MQYLVNDSIFQAVRLACNVNTIYTELCVLLSIRSLSKSSQPLHIVYVPFKQFILRETYSNLIYNIRLEIINYFEIMLIYKEKAIDFRLVCF